MPRRGRRALTLLALVALAGPPTSAAGPGGAAFLGRAAVAAGEGGIGGLSGLVVAAGGEDFVAVSDRGRIVAGHLRRDAAGALVAAAAGPALPLADRAGRPLARRRADAEAIAAAPGGGFFVAFEGAHRVVFYPRPGAAAGRSLPPLPGDGRLPANTGVEALATDARGLLHAIPERPPPGRDDLPVWRLLPSGWEEVAALDRIPPFSVTGADFGPDGALYVLERAVVLPFGFRSRVRRFALGRGGAGEVVLLTPPGRHGNLEGIAVWRDATGGLRLTMVADDNFLPLLATEVVEYRLP
ncbi:MAG: esterase-like activity of phytase family protein [Rhodobacteraceae bacterium]|nr:esterase-like activity of phytase family protein [Paracoccaceae bacterium]